MNTRLVLERATAVLLFALPAMAATDTWDGGGGNDLITLGANWVDNTAPVSDIANTDLIFAGLNRLTPSLNASFSTRSITFNNAAGAFTIGGQAFIVGTSGIVNNDTQTMTFDNLVRFSAVANATINASAGGLSFTGTVVLPSDTLTVTGGSPARFTNISGDSTLNIKDAGTMTWTPGLATSCDVTVTTGTLTMGADGGADLFNSSATIAVNGTSTFNINESLTLDGAQLTRASGAFANLAAGKTLTVQNGGDAIITGPFENDTASTIAVTGAGSTFSTTSSLTLNGGSTLNVTADGDVTSGTSISIGTAENGTVTVDGTGSTLAGASSLLVGANTDTGSLTFTNNSGGTFTSISLVASTLGGATGMLSIQSDADVTGTSLNLASLTGANTGTVTVTGQGSTLTLDGAGAATIGAASASSGTLNVNNNATFHSGTGLTTVNPTGTISIADGVYFSHGNLTINGGQLNRSADGFLFLDATRTLTVQGAGDVNITGSLTNNVASTIAVTGAGATFSTSSFTSLNGGAALHISDAGDATCGSLFIGFSGSSAVTVDGVGSTLAGDSFLIVGANTGAGSLTFTNGSTGTFTGDFGMQLLTSTMGGASGAVNIESGADVTARFLTLAAATGANTGTVTVTGAGSTLTLNDAAASNTIGAASASAATLNVQSGGAVTTANLGTTIAATGTIAITGGTFTSNNPITINGGRLTRSGGGAFTLAAGQALSVQGGGDAVFSGVYSTPNSATIAVTGAGSTFSTNSTFNAGGGTAVNVLAGGSLSAGTANIGSFGGSATATIDGAGSSLTASTLAVGQNGFTGTLTFSNGSTGTMDTINVDFSGLAGTVGILNIQSGAAVTGTNLNLANGTLANSGTVLITGPGSALTLTGTATIGTASAPTGTLTVESGGTFTTGTGLTTVNATGDLNIKTGGTLTGAADFSGTGPVNIAGDFLPGTASGVNQTTSVSFAQNMTFHPTTGITMEIGGTAPGTQHDQIVFNGVGSTQIKWDGTLKLVLINGFAPQAGQTFDLFDFDAARDAGAFTTIDVVTNGLMPPGLAFNFDELHTTGVISVVSTGGITFAQWAATELGDPGASPLGDHNGNGYTNLIEYALGLFPAVPGTVEPNGGLHTYPDGERLRVLFTRPLDRTGIAIRVQVSADLTNWSDLAVSVNSASFTGGGFVSENRAHPVSEPGLVEVRDNLNASSEGRRSLRIQVALPP